MNTSVKVVYKILDANIWRQAVDTGCFDGVEIDIDDGYIHFSTAEQVVETAAKHFAGRENLVLVAVDSGLLGEALKWEPSRGGALFPHLHGSLTTGADSSAVLWSCPLPLIDGVHQFPDKL